MLHNPLGSEVRKKCGCTASPRTPLLVLALFPAAPGEVQSFGYAVLSTHQPQDLHRSPAGLNTSAATRASVWHFHKASNFGSEGLSAA